MIGIEGEDIVEDADLHVGELHGQRGTVGNGLHLTEHIVVAIDGHLDFLGGSWILGLGEGDDIGAEARLHRGLAVFKVDMKVEVVVGFRFLVALSDIDGVALDALDVFPLVDAIEAAR